MVTKIRVSGMTCGGSCASILERSLKTVPGVETATVDLRNETLMVEGGADVGAVVATTGDEGYRAKGGEGRCS